MGRRELTHEQGLTDRPRLGQYDREESGEICGSGVVAMRLKGDTAMGQAAARSGRWTREIKLPYLTNKNYKTLNYILISRK